MRTNEIMQRNTIRSFLGKLDKKTEDSVLYELIERYGPNWEVLNLPATEFEDCLNDAEIYLL